jgi:Ca2+-transporting ATPase
MNWHNVDTESLFALTGTTAQGLSDAEAQERLADKGPNLLTEKGRKPAWRIVASQFSDFMILILAVAAVISGFIGELRDTFIIVVIIVLNGILGFFQEYRAERAVEALKKMAALKARVLRGGTAQEVDAAELVPGDLVLLEAGNIVPADIRLIEAAGIRVDESSLTGESVPVEKTSASLGLPELPLGDRINMMYKSTLVTGGRGTGVVVATGMQTEVGTIAGLLSGREAPTPLQVRMKDFGKKLSWLVLFICALLFVVGVVRGHDVLSMLLLSISLAVAAIPEALPALITIALAHGARRMARGSALVRKLHAVETLGSVSYICTDKTGTLTANRMEVVDTEDTAGDDRPPDVPLLNLCMAISHDARPGAGETWTGDPTERALVEHVANRLGDEQVASWLKEYPRKAELPFDSDRKRMTTAHAYGDGFLLVCKGAAEALADCLASEGERQVLLARAQSMSERGMRVIAYGYRLLRSLPAPFTAEEAESGLMACGLAGMMDPLRPGVPEAIQECRTAGIRVVMITGDHPATAAAIARDLGILDGGLIVTGQELSRMEDEELGRKAEEIGVYARVSPEQKLRIVHALQHKGHFVAVTGDGVNDAPSLRAANIGVAMGMAGTDVSKQAAHMILTDDNFATIVRAVREGRRIYDNIRKFVKYIMTCNSAELLTIFLAPLVGLPLPLLPIHILWINLVTDGLPGLSLAGERAEADIMRRPPRGRSESLFAGGIGYHIVWVGLLMAFVTLFVQAWAWHRGVDYWQTMVFTVLALSQIGHALAIRSDTEFLYRRGLFSNPALITTAILTGVVQLIVIYLPAANALFRTRPLPLPDLLACMGLSAVVFHAVELEKYIRRRMQNKQSAVTAGKPRTP